MAVRQLQQNTVAEAEAEAEAVLRQHGILPDAAGKYTEATLAAAIAERGWTYDVRLDSGAGWVVRIDEDLGPDDCHGLSGGGPDRTTALLKALVAALGFLGEAHERWVDDRVRHLTGMSKAQFLEGWRAGRFDAAIRNHQHPDFHAVYDVAMLLRLER